VERTNYEFRYELLANWLLDAIASKGDRRSVIVDVNRVLWRAALASLLVVGLFVAALILIVRA
jgi:hypothetical protein